MLLRRGVCVRVCVSVSVWCDVARCHHRAPTQAIATAAAQAQALHRDIALLEAGLPPTSERALHARPPPLSPHADPLGAVARAFNARPPPHALQAVCVALSDAPRVANAAARRAAAAAAAAYEREAAARAAIALLRGGTASTAGMSGVGGVGGMGGGASRSASGLGGERGESSYGGSGGLGGAVGGAPRGGWGGGGAPEWEGAGGYHFAARGASTDRHGRGAFKRVALGWGRALSSFLAKPAWAFEVS